MSAATTQLPAGLVTFVFTDIEGSTRLLTRLRDDAPRLVERHREILRAAWREHGGNEVNTEGDGSFVAFADTDDALLACAAAQRGLASEAWPAGATVRCRMGVHVGVASPRQGDYIAIAVHQAARIVAAGHGGQIIVSEAAAGRAGGSAAELLTPIGHYRIRDFDGPQLLSRLDVDGVPVVATPIRATPAGEHNLVAPPTTFVDRRADVAAIVEAVGPGRIISLIGPGGVGKTRLATEIGLQVVPDWRDGVWIIDLADLTEPWQIAEETADTIDAPTTGGGDRWDDVLAWAAGRNSLLIFDNLEHHVETCARLLPTLLGDNAIGIVTTGREPLKVAGEHTHRVLPLDVPDADTDLATIDTVAGVELFADRARMVMPDFEVDAANRAAIATLVARLDGLPLALEISASRVSVLTIDEIVVGLDDRFRLLRSRDRSLPARQRTLEALLDWSYRLLPPEERTAFRRLAVFGGSFTKEAAAIALGDGEIDADDVPELVWSLVDKSLLVSDLTEQGTRYRLPETVREYANRLVGRDEAVAAARRLAEWLLAELGPWRAADRHWISSVATELANLRSLCERLADPATETAQEIACAVGRYHDATQSFAIGIDELGRAVEALTAPTPARVAMLAALADLHLRGAHTEEAETLLAEAVDLQSEVGPPPWNDAAVDRTRGELASRAGDYEGAIAVARAALDRDLSRLARARMSNLEGIARYASGDLAGAAIAFERELSTYDELDYEANLASAHGNLAEVELQLGHVAAAAGHQLACLEGALEIGQPVMVAYSLLIAARLAGIERDWALAVRLQGAADRQLDLLGHELYETDRENVDDLVRAAVDALGRDRADEERAAGAALDIFDAARLASGIFSAAQDRRGGTTSNDTADNRTDAERSPT